MVLRPESEWWSWFGVVETARDSFTCHFSSLRTQYICTESRVEGRTLGACMLGRDHSFCLRMHRIWPPLSPHLFLKPHKHGLCPPSWVVHWDLGQMYGHLLNICTLSYDTGVTLKFGTEDCCLENPDHLAVTDTSTTYSKCHTAKLLLWRPQGRTLEILSLQVSWSKAKRSTNNERQGLWRSRVA